MRSPADRIVPASMARRHSPLVDHEISAHGVYPD